MRTQTRIARKVATRDRLEAQGYRVKLCPNCGGSARVPGRRPKCQVCNGRGYNFHRPN